MFGRKSPASRRTHATVSATMCAVPAIEGGSGNPHLLVPRDLAFSPDGQLVIRLARLGEKPSRYIPLTKGEPSDTLAKRIVRAWDLMEVNDDDEQDAEAFDRSELADLLDDLQDELEDVTVKQARKEDLPRTLTQKAWDKLQRARGRKLSLSLDEDDEDGEDNDEDFEAKAEKAEPSRRGKKDKKEDEK